MNNKITNKDALNAVKAFTEQGKKNVALGVLADTENGNISTFIKGEEVELLAVITMQMAKENDFKRLLFKAVALYKFTPMQKIIEEYEQD